MIKRGRVACACGDGSCVLCDDNGTLPHPGLVAVLEAMQPLDELGGPDWGDYVAIMLEIARVARERAARAEANRPDPSPLPSVRALGVAFFRQIETTLTAARLREVRRLNARETNPHVCHTHDFCDANMAMDAAFRALGIDVDIENDAHVDLWNSAWSYAGERFLGSRS